MLYWLEVVRDSSSEHKEAITMKSQQLSVGFYPGFCSNQQLALEQYGFVQLTAVQAGCKPDCCVGTHLGIFFNKYYKLIFLIDFLNKIFLFSSLLYCKNTVYNA